MPHTLSSDDSANSARRLSIAETAPAGRSSNETSLPVVVLPGNSTSVALERRYQLDSLRALATVIVVFVHTRVRGNLLADVGPLGLAFFFVLSGFLITGILLDARDRADVAGIGRGGVLWRFYVRRFLRIFPLYYGVLLVVVLLGEPVTRQYISELATYRTNFLLARLGRNVAPITPLWSLSVEEHFYLLWPLIALFASRRVLWGSIVLMVVGSFVIRGVLVLQHATYQAIAWPTYCAVDSIALGCALALAWRSTAAEARKPWIFRALVAGAIAELARLALYVVPLTHTVAINRTLNTLPFALVCVWIVDRGAQDRLPAWLRNVWLARLGLVSYAVYVVHRYVMHFLGFDQERGWKVFAITLSVSILIATISWQVYEGPINNLKRFFPYVKRSPVPVPVIAQMAEG
jgi:peptidoglycan/LPS O-acetylase OafA/YrhL